ncbi:MAG: PDR/VanB family oxidoreductase [Sciscionella sp.]
MSVVADNIVALELVDPAGRRLPTWEAGAHIDLLLPSGTVRQYSLCGDLDARHRYRIAVLRDEMSRGGSVEIHDTGLVGKHVKVGGPRNRFPLVDAPRYLFLAGGIGVTPLLAMVQQAERFGTPWQLVYGGRTPSSLGFVDELAARRHGTVTVITEDREGRPDLRQLLSEIDSDTAVYCCGPAGMLDAVQAAGDELLAPGTLHTEHFGVPDKPDLDTSQDTGFEIELARTGVTLAVPPDRSILDVVLDVVPNQLFFCEEGYCGTCETRVLAGEPEHRDAVLREEERKDRMMICVGRARSSRLVLDI